MTNTKSAQAQLDFSKIEMKPLHIFYLLAIHVGDFDQRLHNGHFINNTFVFAQRIRELITMGLIIYDGRHRVTPLGAKHVEHLLSVPPTMGGIKVTYVERK